MYYGAGDIRIADLPRPEIGQGDLGVEMKACGICGSDLMDWYLRDRTPLVLGHEPVGLVVEAGKGVDAFQTGDRVFAHHHVACLKCHNCRRGQFTLCTSFRNTHLDPGGFAEFFRVPEKNVLTDTLKIPHNMTDEEATFIEPTGCCLRGAKQAAVQPGDNAAIVGAGPTGLLLLRVLQAIGVNRTFVSDLTEFRLDFARRLGASVSFNPSEGDFPQAVRDSLGQGADVVFVTAPNVSAFQTGLKLPRSGGTVCVFAPTPPEIEVAVSPNGVFFSELKIVGSYSTSHLETKIALDLISSGRLKVSDLVTHRFGLEEARDAFALATSGKECVKIIVHSRR